MTYFKAVTINYQIPRKLILVDSSYVKQIIGKLNRNDAKNFNSMSARIKKYKC